MGQYHKPVNLTKKQFLHPHAFNDGLKAMEFGCNANGTMTALAYLLTSSKERGGGDFPIGGPLAGSWAGDQIAIIGDYSEPMDIPGVDAKAIWEAMSEEEYADISAAVRTELMDVFAE